VLLLSAALRLLALGSPPTRYGDEFNYALGPSGKVVLPPLMPFTAVPVPPGVETIANNVSWVHPPLAQILISWGEWAGGFTAVSWRLPSALFGVLGVAAVYAIGYRLWRSAWWASLAGLLVAEDGLHIVQSRVAMLDIFMSTFLMLGLLCLLLAWHSRRSPARWVVLAGLFFGAAIASKWSALFVVLPASVMWLALAGWRHLCWERLWRFAGALIVAPAVVYVASYSMFFVQHGPDVRGFVRLETAMLTFHEDTDMTHPMSSRAATWPLMLRPSTYYYGGEGFSPTGQMLPTSREKEIMALGNPVLWWGWLGLAPLALWGAIRRRRWSFVLPVVGYLCCFLPWVFISRTEFFYYMLAAAPFMALGACAAVQSLSGRAASRAAGTLAVLSTFAMLFFAPHWLGLPVPVTYGHYLRWLNGWM